VLDSAAALARRLRLPGGARGAASWDLGLAAVLAAASFVPQLAGNGLQFGQLAVRPADTWSALLTLGQCLPLSVRRRWPLLCLVVVTGSFAAFQSLGYRTDFASAGLFVAVYSAGAHLGRSRRGVAAVATAGYVALAATLHALRSPERLIDYGTFYLALVICWRAGSWMRARQAAEVERRRESAQQATAAERARIVREIHDGVTHHVTAIVVQADSAQYLVGSAPDRAVDSLSAISGTGRRALAELRHLLGVLEGPEGAAGPRPGVPAPSVEEAPASGRFRDLVERTRQAGQPAELFEDGDDAPIAGAAQHAAYRVVQEALTNAVKHAPGRRTVVRVRYGTEIRIDVTSAGPVIAERAFTPGRGLTGLRERVNLCGGELSAGARPGGGFVVSARIPSAGVRE
jgi:signal transduction histidine kinase